jgi:hypothetical protein
MGGGERYPRVAGHIGIQVEVSDCPAADATLM